MANTETKYGPDVQINNPLNKGNITTHLDGSPKSEPSVFMFRGHYCSDGSREITIEDSPDDKDFLKKTITQLEHNIPFKDIQIPSLLYLFNSKTPDKKQFVDIDILHFFDATAAFRLQFFHNTKNGNPDLFSTDNVFAHLDHSVRQALNILRGRERNIKHLYEEDEKTFPVVMAALYFEFENITQKIIHGEITLPKETDPNFEDSYYSVERNLRRIEDVLDILDAKGISNYREVMHYIAQLRQMDLAVHLMFAAMMPPPDNSTFESGLNPVTQILIAAQERGISIDLIAQTLMLLPPDILEMIKPQLIEADVNETYEIYWNKKNEQVNATSINSIKKHISRNILIVSQILQTLNRIQQNLIDQNDK